MKPALELAVENYQRLRDEAATALELARKELVSLRNTLSTLEGYRNTLQDRRRESGDTARSIASLQMDTHFAGRIESAIRQQEHYIEHAVRRTEQKRLELLNCQKRLKAVEIILKQRAERAARMLARQERLATDEQAALKHLSTRNAMAACVDVELDSESYA